MFESGEILNRLRRARASAAIAVSLSFAAALPSAVASDILVARHGGSGKPDDNEFNIIELDKPLANGEK